MCSGASLALVRGIKDSRCEPGAGRDLRGVVGWRLGYLAAMNGRCCDGGCGPAHMLVLALCRRAWPISGPNEANH